MSWLLFIPQVYFHWIKTLIDSCFILRLEKWLQFPFGLSGFWWEICCRSHCFPLIGDVSFLFSVFKISSLSSAFWSLIMNYLGVNFFEFIVSGVQLATWICSLSFAKFLESFKHYLWQYFQLHLLSLFLLQLRWPKY